MCSQQEILQNQAEMLSPQMRPLPLPADGNVGDAGGAALPQLYLFAEARESAAHVCAHRLVRSDQFHNQQQRLESHQ